LIQQTILMLQNVVEIEYLEDILQQHQLLLVHIYKMLFVKIVIPMVKPSFKNLMKLGEVGSEVVDNSIVQDMKI